MADIKKGLTILRAENGGLIIGEGADAVRITAKGDNLNIEDATTHVDSMYPNHWPFGGYPNYIPSDEEVSNFDYMYPPDNTPVALLPGAIRAAKRFAAYFASTKAAFSADVVDGDVVYLDTDGIWRPAIAPLTEAAIPADKKPFYGVAFLARREVVIGPMIKHLKWKFNIGDKLYLSDSEAGKLTTRVTTLPFATAVAPDTIYVSMLGADISTSLDELEKVITDRIDALDAELKALEGRVDTLETTVAEHTQTIKEEKARLDGALSSIAQLRAQLDALEQKFNQHISGDGGHIDLTDRIDLDDSTKGASAKAAKTLADMIQKFSTVDVMSIDPFITDGTSTDYQVGDDIVLDTNANNLFLVVDGVVQEPYVAYTIPNNKTIRFTQAPERDLRCWGAASMNYSNPDIREALKKALEQLQLEGDKIIALARAWAESDTNPDPDDPDSKSAKTWANSIKETIVQEVAKQVPLATKNKPGIVQVGFGLSVDSRGVVSVDFSEDDTTSSKFEELMKQIRVPIWLSRNMTFHVNGVSGSDTLEPGLGESTDKPFKTLQACIDYICSNYNVDKYFVDIKLHSGTYTGPFTLGDFSRTTGGIRISSYDSDYAATLTAQDSYLLNALGGTWTLQGLNVNSVTTERPDYAVPMSTGFMTVTNCLVNIDGCNFNASYSGGEPVKARLLRLFTASSGGVINFLPTRRSKNLITFTKGSATELSVLFSSFGGQINLAASADSQEECTLNASGDCTVFAAASGGSITRPAALNYYAIVQGSVTGKRYAVTHGGIISVAGAGSEFFPGTEVGTVDPTTFGWYA